MLLNNTVVFVLNIWFIAYELKYSKGKTWFYLFQIELIPAKKVQSVPVVWNDHHIMNSVIN